MSPASDLIEMDTELRGLVLQDDPETSATMLADVIDEELPSILVSLTFPPPPTKLDLAIATSIHEGRGGFRPDKFADLLHRVENEGTVEELRRLQRRLLTYEGDSGAGEREDRTSSGNQSTPESANWPYAPDQTATVHLNDSGRELQSTPEQALPVAPVALALTSHDPTGVELEWESFAGSDDRLSSPK